MDGLIPVSALKPAAQYLRMSTEHQRYSLANQASAIQNYAVIRGFRIVRTYVDAGKSGLTITQRDGLQMLMGDVISGVGGYEAVLVLDVSRWGRFQDPDQAAHYEFVCRESGVAVHYCAEPFENDGTIVSSIVKTVKRLMAAEYSRDLSERISRTKRRAATAGFVQGGRCPYGLERIVVDHLGQQIGRLKAGQHKIAGEYRVTYGLGDQVEVKTVAEIFRLYVRQRNSPRTIAHILNCQNAPSPKATSWTGPLVRRILNCSTYCGEYIYGRRAQRLKSTPVSQPTDQWIIVQTPSRIVSKRIFSEAQRLLTNYKQIPLSKAELLDRLKRLLSEKGGLSASIIDACKYTPTGHSCFKAFGGAARLYEMLDYDAPVSRFRRMGRDQVVEGLKQLLAERGYITTSLVNADVRLPNATTIVSDFGSIRAAFAAAGYERSWSEISRESHFRVTGGRYRIAARKDEKGAPKISNLCIGRDTEFSKDVLLGWLRSLQARNGFVSGAAINEDAAVPPAGAYRRVFGSLTEAYKLAGLPTQKSSQLRARFKKIPKARHQASAI